MLVVLCLSFGRSAAHGGVDGQLTLNDEATYERMLQAREGVIGNACEKDVQRHGGFNYLGPGHAPVKSTVSLFLRILFF